MRCVPSGCFPRDSSVHPLLDSLNNILLIYLMKDIKKLIVFYVHNVEAHNYIDILSINITSKGEPEVLYRHAIYGVFLNRVTK
jgi:hypothetical protein